MQLRLSCYEVSEPGAFLEHLVELPLDTAKLFTCTGRGFDGDIQEAVCREYALQLPGHRLHAGDGDRQIIRARHSAEEQQERAYRRIGYFFSQRDEFRG